MTTAVHLAFAAAGTLLLWRAAIRVAQGAPDEAVAAALPLAVLLATAFGSLGAVVAGRAGAMGGSAPSAPAVSGAGASTGRRSAAARALTLDAITWGMAAWWLFVMTLGPWTRELGGVSLVAIAAARLAPTALAVASMRAPAWLAFVVALGAYGALAVWLPAASLPLGDQVHYLLAADGLLRGSLDATLDAGLFRSILGIAPGPADVATHVADTPLGPRPIQGYAMPLLLLPGWALFGRLGAHLTMAAVAAWASYQTFLILRDLSRLAPDQRPKTEPVEERQSNGLKDRVPPILPYGAAGLSWLMASFLAPMPLLATHLYPNAVGAALIATAFRFGFTAPVLRPALAAALLALTLFLTPRDGLALLVLLPFLLWRVANITQFGWWMHQIGSRRPRPLNEPAPPASASSHTWPVRKIALAVGAVLLLAVGSNALLYGLPLPYAGYVFGTAQAQELTREGSITPRIWLGLPAILFDRTFGLAGTAPWVFIGLLGLVPLLRLERADRRVLLPAALTVGASVLALSFFRLWEGGYAPPNRYFVDVLPLWTPFVAFGLATAGGRMRFKRGGELVDRLPLAWLVRSGVAIVIFASALATLVLNGIPTTALNTAFDHQVRDAFGRILGWDPLGWLPSFQPTTADWVASAYLRLVPAAAVAAALVWLGFRASRAPVPPAPLSVALAPQAVTKSVGTSQETDRAAALWLGVNAVGIGLTALATWQPWTAGGADPVPEALLRKWLPLALALATAGTFLVGRLVGPDARASLLRRHFLVYAVPPALMLLEHTGAQLVLNGQRGALYLAVAVLFALNALAALWGALDPLRDRGTAPDRLTDPRAAPLTDRGVALHLALVGLVAFLIVLPYDRAIMLTASDEPHYLLISQSIIRDRDLDLRNDYAGDYSAFYPGRLPDMHGIEIGSAVYPIRDLGLPVLSAIPFAVAGRVGVLVLMCLVGAALVLQLYLLLRDLRFAPRVAFLAVATTALTHPILTYTTQIYPELLTALVFVSVARLLRAGAAATVRELAVASALVALLPVLSTRAWPIAVGCGLVVAYAALRPAWEARRAATGTVRSSLVRLAAAALPFAAIVAVLSFVNWRMFGVFLPSAGYYLIREQQQVLAYAPHVGAAGLFFDRVFGLIPRAPVYLLGFLGIAALVRRARPWDEAAAERELRGHGPELAVLALGGGLSLLYIANIAYWWADGSPPSRYLLGAIPLLVAAVAGGWEIVLGATGRIRAPLSWLAWALAIASAAIAYVYAMQPNTRYDLVGEIRATGSSGRLFGFIDEKVGLDPAQLFPSLVVIDATMAALAAVWVALAVALVWLGRRAPAASS